jgi:hypothetical protein
MHRRRNVKQSETFPKEQHRMAGGVESSRVESCRVFPFTTEANKQICPNLLNSSSGWARHGTQGSKVRIITMGSDRSPGMRFSRLIATLWRPSGQAIWVPSANPTWPRFIVENPCDGIDLRCQILNFAGPSHLLKQMSQYVVHTAICDLILGDLV